MSFSPLIHTYGLDVAMSFGHRLGAALRKSSVKISIFTTGVVVAGIQVSSASCDEAKTSSSKKLGMFRFNRYLRAPCSSSAASGSPSAPDGSDPVKQFISKYSFFLQNLGFSGFVGVCSGAALKRLSREVAYSIGLAFVGLQMLAHLGYISIDYNRIEKEATKVLDVNGDGKLDEKDLQDLWSKLQATLAYQLPQAGSFSTGFMLGCYYF